MTNLRARASAKPYGWCILLVMVAGCSGSFEVGRDGVSLDPDPIVIVPGDTAGGPRRTRSAEAYGIPPGHHPPPGACRIWFPGRPPGQQPPPTSCEVDVPRGAVLVRG